MLSYYFFWVEGFKHFQLPDYTGLSVVAGLPLLSGIKPKYFQITDLQLALLTKSLPSFMESSIFNSEN